MATTTRKPLTFNVSTDVYNRFKQLFPNDKLEDKADCSEANLVTILEAFEHPHESNTDLQHRCDEQQNTIDKLRKSNEQLSADNSQLKAQMDDLLVRLESLANDSAQLSTAQQRCNRLENDIQELAAEREGLKVTVDTLQNTINDMQTRIETLQAAAVDPGTNITGHLDDFTSELLEIVTQRLRDRTKVENLTRMQVLIDGFLKYNIQQYNLWFYEFVMSKSEILELAHKHNSQIDSYRKLQKALGIYE